MKGVKQLITTIFLLLTITASSQNIPAKPNPPRLVNDLANVMTGGDTEATREHRVFRRPGRDAGVRRSGAGDHRRRR